MTIKARNPLTGIEDYSFEPATAADVHAEVKRLRAGQKNWAAIGADARAQVLIRWADAIEAEKQALSTALSADTGRRFLSDIEVMGTISSLRRWAALAPETLAMEKAGLSPSAMAEGVSYGNQYVPYPVCGFITPWNFPLTLSLIDAVPALAAGCAVIIKPSEVTPRFAEPLMRTIEAVPELAAVTAIVLGDGSIGQALIEEVDLVCFTGSVPTGRKVAEAAARRFIPAFLELGGKDPVIITRTADLQRATDAVLRGSVTNAGQVCLSIERIYVDEAIHDEFVDLLVEKTAQLRLNSPDASEGHVGPLIFARQGAIIEAHLNDAVQKGATIRHGGKLVENGGIWCEPTVLTGVTHDMDVMRDETFGPVMPVMPFRTVEQAIELANDTSFGLSAAVIAGTEEEALDIARHVNAGGLSINDCGLTVVTFEPEKMAFGLSGMGGSRMGPAAIHRFLRKKALIVQAGHPTRMEHLAEGSLPFGN